MESLYQRAARYPVAVDVFVEILPLRVRPVDPSVDCIKMPQNGCYLARDFLIARRVKHVDLRVQSSIRSVAYKERQRCGRTPH